VFTKTAFDSGIGELRGTRGVGLRARRVSIPPAGISTLAGAPPLGELYGVEFPAGCCSPVRVNKPSASGRPGGERS
jgi:hypothetical protein